MSQKNNSATTFLERRGSSEKFLAEQSRNFATFLSELRQIESEREDTIETIRHLTPVDMTDDRTWTIAGKNDKLYYITEPAQRQLGNSRSKSALRSSYLNTLPDSFTTYDINGNEITIPMKHTAFLEAMKTRPRAAKMFRAVPVTRIKNNETIQRKEVLGIVGEHYPKFSELQLAEAILEVSNGIGIKIRPSHFRQTNNGTINMNFVYTNPELIFETPRTPENLGFFFSNNNYGQGSFKGGITKFEQVCSNGLMAWVPKISFNIEHSTKRTFIRDILDNIAAAKKMVNKDLFGFEFEFKYLKETEYYLTNFEELYHPIAMSTIVRSLAGGQEVKKGVQKAIKTYVSWVNEIQAQCKQYRVTKQTEELVISTAKKDPTINIDPNKPATMYDVSAAFTSTANMLTGAESMLLQEIGGNIILKSRPITPVIKV